MLKSDTILALFYISSAFVSLALGLLRIKELNIPTSVQDGEVTEIVLDCNFEVINETGVVVKWFYNGDKDQIYQWIPGPNMKPFPMGSLKNFIDATYKVTDDQFTMYRAIKLFNVTRDLSGMYKCKVTGDDHDAVEAKNLTIFVPPLGGLNLTVDREELSAVCSVDGVYPEPELSLQLYNGNGTDETTEIQEMTSEDDNVFNKTKILSFSNESMSLPVDFICHMRIPGTDYELIERRHFSIENCSLQHHCSRILLNSLLILVFYFVITS